MSDGQRGKTGKLGAELRSPINTAIELQNHQRRAEALGDYAPDVLPVLKDLLYRVFGETQGYGVDDNIDGENGEQRYGWRIFGLGAGETKFNDFTPNAPQRKTIIAVELIFNDAAQPTGFLIDTRRTRTTLKTGLLGMKQKISVTVGGTKKVPLNAGALADGLEEMAQTMDR